MKAFKFFYRQLINDFLDFEVQVRLQSFALIAKFFWFASSFLDFQYQK